MASTKWSEACGECGHEQGYHHDDGDQPDVEHCELCPCPRFVPSGKAATHDTPEERSSRSTDA
jgi:hypothetical protein